MVLLAGRPPRPAPFPPVLRSLAMRAGPSDCLVLSTAGLSPPNVCRRLLLILLCRIFFSAFVRVKLYSERHVEFSAIRRLECHSGNLMQTGHLANDKNKGP